MVDLSKGKNGEKQNRIGLEKKINLIDLLFLRFSRVAVFCDVSK